jgi:hypothetical protein
MITEVIKFEFSDFTLLEDERRKADIKTSLDFVLSELAKRGLFEERELGNKIQSEFVRAELGTKMINKCCMLFEDAFNDEMKKLLDNETEGENNDC